MTPLDWLIVVLALLFAVYGALRGFVAGILGLVGFIAGAVIGARLAPHILHGGSRSPWAPMVALACAAFLGGLLASVLGGVGDMVRRRMRLPAFGVVDGLLGAVLGAATVLCIAWLAGAVALQTPGLVSLRRDVQRSEVLSTLNDALPPSGPILQALARVDPLPAVRGPSSDEVERPTRGILATPGVRAAKAGTVRVLGAACGLQVEGSGWLAGSGLVVTNAHVVAGTGGNVVVQEQGTGPARGADALVFDTRNDIAVLAVSGLRGHALEIVGEPERDTAGAILGYPGNGPFSARAARIGDTSRVVSEDAYGRGPVERDMAVLRGRVKHGNSGGPVVDRRGRVLTTVFAEALGDGPPSGYGVPNAVVRRALAQAHRRTRSVSTGPCTA